MTLRMNSSKLFRLVLQIAVSGGLIWLVIIRTNLEELARIMAGVSVPLLFTLSIFLVLSSVWVLLRWQVVMIALGGRIEFRGGSRAVILGLFFNQTLPSTLGGDVVRIWHASAYNPMKTVVNGVVLDRSVALATLVLMCLIALPFWGSVARSPLDIVPVLLLVALGVGGLLLILGVRFLPHSWVRFRLISFAEGLSRDAWLLLARRDCALKGLALSVAMHGYQVFSMYLIARLIDVDLPFSAALFLGPPIILASMLPISIAGWGVRESAAISAFALVGLSSDQSVAISLLFGAVHLGAGAIGGAVWVLLRVISPTKSPRSHGARSSGAN